MRTLRHVVLLLLGFSMWVGLLSPSLAAAAGLWKGRVVDAETGQPLEGVVVLAYWIKYTGGWGGWGGGEFYDSEEVVTGPDGRFVIQARSIWMLLWWKKIQGYFVMFKPGYGQWRYKGYEEWQKLPIWEREAREEAVRKWEETGEIEGDRVVIELPPLKTRADRLKFYGGVSWSLVPLERTKRLRETLDEERAYLGLGRMYREKQ